MRSPVIRVLLKCSKALGFFALSRWITRKQLRILCYHGIWLGGPPHYGDCLFMDRERFARRIELISRLGYPVISLEEAVPALAAGTLPDGAVVITIDDAWYGTYAHMLPALKRHRLPATLYVTTYYAVARRPVLNVLIGYMVARSNRVPDMATLFPASAASESPIDGADANRPATPAAIAARIDALPSLELRWQELKRVAARLKFDVDAVQGDRRFELMNEAEIRQARADGFDVQLHTHTHRMGHFDPVEVGQEIRRNREELARILEAPPDSFKHFCYPSGEYDPKIFETLRALKVKSATTTEFGLNAADADPLALKRILDCDSMSDIELESRLCGFWSLLAVAVKRGRRGQRKHSDARDDVATAM